MSILRTAMSRTRPGFSMAEIGFWLLIVSIFIGGGIAYYYATRGTAYEVKAAQAVQDLQTAAMACWLPRGHTTFEGLSIEVLRDDGCLAAGFSGTGSNPWGGDYSVGPDPADATPCASSSPGCPTRRARAWNGGSRRAPTRRATTPEPAPSP